MVVLLAPLLIVLVIGFGFSGTGIPVLNVGVYAPDNGDLTNRYISNMNTTENNIIRFDDSKKCVDSIVEGLIVTCVVFPESFVLENEVDNEVLFYVDESRINLVHRLIASLTTNLDTESSEVTQELASRLLGIIAKTSANTENSLVTIIGLKAKTKTGQDTTTNSASTLNNLDADEESIDLTDVTKDVDSLIADFKTLRSKAETAVKSGYLIANDLGNSSEASELIDTMDKLNASIVSSKDTYDGLSSLTAALDTAENSVKNMKTKLSAARTSKTRVLTDLNLMSTTLSSMSTDLNTVKQKLEEVALDISKLTITDASAISNPITTKIEPVVANNTQLTYSFPYLLMLIVLFVGMMLSSTIVFMEKDSRAYFRTFTTPLTNSFFLWITYVTSALVILVQTILILVGVHFGLGVPAFANFGMTALFIFLSLTVFVSFGIFIGHLFSTSEGITMSTIAIGSVMLFLSNLILPLETLDPLIQQIAKFNPYVIASEGIRKAMLFEIPFQELYSDLFILLGYSVLLLGITLLAMKIMSSKYLEKMHYSSRKNMINVPEDHYLHIKEIEVTIKDMQSLIETLKTMSDQDFEKITKPKNIFADWIKLSYKAKTLALVLKKKSRTRTIEILEKYVKRKFKS